MLAASVQLMQTMQLNDANKGRNKPFLKTFSLSFIGAGKRRATAGEWDASSPSRCNWSPVMGPLNHCMKRT